MPIKTLHREDIEKLVSLTYTQTPVFTLNGVAHKCRALKVDSFDDAIKFLKDNSGHIVYFDQLNHYEDEFSIGEADAFIIRYADMSAETPEDGPRDVKPPIFNSAAGPCQERVS